VSDARALGFGDLVLCAGTVPFSSLQERVVAAAEAGFAALSLFPHDYQRARASGLSDADLRGLLRDHDIRVAEIDPLLSWMPSDAAGAGVNEAGRAFLATGEDEFYAIADALGARSINAALADPRPVELDVVADAFGTLCDRAAAHGLFVTLEFLPWTTIRDAATAASVAIRAGRANGGVMLDAWHHFRSGAGIASIPAALVLGIQINDAPAQAEADLIDETLHRRLAPGEGEIDLAGLLRHLAAGGCTAPIGVEVFSDASAAAPLRDTTQRMADAARRILAASRGSSS
jgi:sugar phosphate isomerase/epimerase